MTRMTSGLGNLRSAIRTRYRQWISRRIPPARKVTLDQRRVFIFPTVFGFFYLAVVLALFLGGINYENNLILVFTFLLASLFLVAILHTFNNLSGLTVAAVKAEPAFAGEASCFHIELVRPPGRTYEALKLEWGGEEPLLEDLVEQQEKPLAFFIPVQARGVFHPPRLKVETVFPLGLLRAWTYIALDMEALVYPRPLPTAELPSQGGEHEKTGQRQKQVGDEEYAGIRSYQAGDSLKHVDWKAFARTDQLLTRQYEKYESGSLWLEWDALPGMDKELRLSRLCYWILKLHREGKPYGLRLPGQILPPAGGEEHLLQALALLARYP